MSNPEGWMLETKQYMNKILNKCTSEEMKTDSNDTTTEGFLEKAKKAFMKGVDELGGWSGVTIGLIFIVGVSIIFLAIKIRENNKTSSQTQ